MELREFLDENYVFEGLENQRRDDVLKELLERLCEADGIPGDRLEDVFHAVVQRESMGTTAIGRGVAVPHARMDGFDRTLIAVGLSEEGVDFRALDGEPVHAIFLVLGDEAKSEEYIDVMKTVSDLVQTDDFRRFVFRANDGAEVVDVMDKMTG
ncbi:MAG: PTS sugar transporter subunit IIA [Planctomycetota bacterium]